MLKGDLSLFSIGEILQSLAINTHTGTLRITSAGRSERQICFKQGEIVYYADDGHSNRVPQLGEVLVRLQIITHGQLEQALAEQQRSKDLLGEVLLRQGFADEKALGRALETQTLEGLYDLFLLKEGTFEFQMNALPEILQAGLWKRVPVALNTNSVLMEGLRQVDEWVLINKHVRTFDEIFRRVDILATPPDQTTGLLLEMINGARPVKDLFKGYPASRFDCCRKLYSLAEAGLIRALGEAELIALAQEKTSAGQHQQATTYLTFAAQINETSASIQSDLGDALHNSGNAAAARLAHLTALRLYYQQTDYLNTTRLGESKLDIASLEVSDLEILFFSYVRIQNFKRAADTGGQLSALHQKAGHFANAAIVMEAIAAMNPNDLNLKIQVAALFEKAGNIEIATRELEAVALALEREKKHRELVKILRLLSQLNPKRQDLKHKIAATHAIIEKLARRRKFQVTLVGLSLIGLLLISVIPCLYEIKARESYSYATSLEQAGMLTMDFKRAKEAYQDIVKNYYFSTRIAAAEEGLERISHLEQTYLTRLEAEAAMAKERLESQMLVVKDELATRLREAESKEQTGDYQQAHAAYVQISRDFSDVPAVSNLLLPLWITTDPGGALVSADDKNLGTTPFVFRYKPGTKLNLTVTRTSCTPLQQTIELTDQWQLRYTLQRKPLASTSLVPTVSQPMLPAGDNIVVVSRDGNVYAITPRTRSIAWQRAVGRFGDRISDLEARGDEIYLATVTGEVTALSASNGKSRWITKIDSSVLAAPAVSEDGRFVAIGATSGALYWLSNENGAIQGKLQTDNEINAKPLFSGKLLIAGSTDNKIYAYSLEAQSVVNELELPADVIGDLIAVGSAFLTYTADGKVFCIDSSTLRILWAHPLGKTPSATLVARQNIVFAGTATGTVVALNLDNGQVIWECAAGKGAISGFVATPSRLHVTLESGHLTSLDISKGVADWAHASDAPIVAPPLLMGESIYVGYMTGRIEQWEVIK